MIGFASDLEHFIGEVFQLWPHPSSTNERTYVAKPASYTIAKVYGNLCFLCACWINMWIKLVHPQHHLSQLQLKGPSK